MAQVIALVSANALRFDALAPLRMMLAVACASALIFAGQPLPL